MTVPVEVITRQRLASWTKRLDQEHATPMILIGVGHDHTCGQAVLCTVEDMTNDDLKKMLSMIVATLEKRL